MPIPQSLEHRYYGLTYGRKGTGPTPQGRPKHLRAAGQATPYGALSPSDVTSWVDGNNNTALFDPSGNIIPGTVRDSEGSPLGNTAFDGATARQLTGAAATTTATTTLSSTRTVSGIPGAPYIAAGLGIVAAVLAGYALTRPAEAPAKSARARANPSRRRHRRHRR